ncbi:MAG: RNA polymerase sigma factor RpoH [Alphaproteobacteria bacterium]|nr:RNA polymerase sigma factor RpoH [Alphaproteobacteria bacterium]
MSNLAQNIPYNDENRDYIRKIRQLPMLTSEEEYTLAKDWRERQDYKSVEKLINSHLRLVAKIAQGYRGYGLPLSDLIAEGNVGILQAMKHYDPDKGFRFSTYAMWWIRASMQEYILQSWSLVKIGTTRAQKKLFFGLRKAQHQIDQELELDGNLEGHQDGLTPEKIKKIAEKLLVTPEEVLQMHQRLGAKDHSLNSPRGNSEDSTSEWIEWIADESDNQEIQLAQQDEMTERKRLFDQAMTCLDKREHAIFVKRRLAEPPRTLEELSTKLGISRERVRQIENKAFEKIQKFIKRLAGTQPHFA